MGISQFNRITGCLSITHSTRGLQGPYTRTQLTTHQPVEGRHRPPAVKKGVVADDNRLTGIVTYDNLESPTRCPSQEFGDEFLVGLGRSGDMHGIRIRWCSGHALNDEQDHDHDDYCSHYQWEQALDHGRSSGIKEVQHLGLGGVYDTYPLNLVRSLDDVLHDLIGSLGSVIGNQLTQVVSELAHQLSTDIAHHTSAELGDLARHLQVGCDLNPCSAFDFLKLCRDVGGGVACSPGVATLSSQDGPIGGIIALYEGGCTLVLGCDRAHLYLDDPTELIALDLLELGSGKAGGNPLNVGEHRPDLSNRGVNLKLVVQLHLSRSSTVSMSTA